MRHRGHSHWSYDVICSAHFHLITDTRVNHAELINGVIRPPKRPVSITSLSLVFTRTLALMYIILHYFRCVNYITWQLPVECVSLSDWVNIQKQKEAHWITVCGCVRCREAQIADLQCMITRRTVQSVHLFTQLELTGQDQTNNRKTTAKARWGDIFPPVRFKSDMIHFRARLLYSSLETSL